MDDSNNVKKELPIPSTKVEHLNELLTVLLSLAPSKRHDALACLSHPFFVKDLNPDRDSSKDLIYCHACLEQCWKDEGITCDNVEKHFYCADCFNRQVVSLDDEPIQKVKARNGDLCCPECGISYDPNVFLPFMKVAIVLILGT